MMKFLKNNWGKIILVLLLLTISILSFKTGYSYLSNDNYSPDLNPLLTIKRSIESPAWRSYRVLGFASESEQADIFRSGLYYILDIFLPTWSLSQIFALLCFVVGSWFTALLTSNLIKDFGKKKYSELAFLLGGIFYITTLWTVWVYYQNMFPYITQFGFLPLVVWSIYRLVKKFSWKNALILFISTMFFTSTFVIATLFVVDIVLISVLTVIFAIAYSSSIKECLKKTFLTVVLIISSQLFWVLPFVHYTANVSGDIIDSYVNRSITTSVIDLESRDQDAINSVKLFTRTVLEEQGDEYIFSRADEYAKYDFFKVVGLIPAVFTLILMIFAIVKKKWLYLSLTILAFIFWFIIKNVNPPFGNIFIWMQQNIPLFKQVFRWASSKTGNIFLLLIAISAPIGFAYLIDFLSSFLKKPLKILLYIVSVLIIVLPTLFYAQYLFTGEIYPERALIEIPSEYYQLEKYIMENEIGDKRILYLPPANNNYFRTYDWGFWGSNFISYILPNPLMDLSSAIGSKYGEQAMIEIQQAFRAKDREKLNALINKYDIEYILVDKTLEEKGFTFSWDWNEVDPLWNKKPLAYSTDNLYLYNTDTESNKVLLESNSQDENTFTYEDDSENPIISLNPESYNNWYIEDNFLISTNKYRGKNITLTNTAESNAILQHPTLLFLKGNNLYLYPGLPSINEVNTQTYKQYEYGDAEILVVDGVVLKQTEILDKYQAIQKDYGSTHQIYTVDEGDMIIDNLTSKLSQSTPYECESGTREESTDVILQGDATGFELRGEQGTPCVYSSLSTTNDSDKVLKVNINWETTNNSLLGYCIYSEDLEKCLNKERYYSSADGIGNIEHLLNSVIPSNEDISLILYALNTKDKPSITVRNISVNLGNIENQLEEISQRSPEYDDTVALSDGDSYKILIPIIKGEESYKLSEGSTVWQPNRTENKEFTTNNLSDGIYQEVTEGFANNSINLYKTEPLCKYLIYWKGENISNIPANICLAYSGDNKCWIQNLFYDDSKESNLEIFTSDQRKDQFDLSVVSTSHNLKTRNRLEDILVMKYPEIWQEIRYTPENTNIRYEVEAKSNGNHLSTTYALSQDSTNSILTIPQASEKGWVALTFKNRLPKILNNKVIVNGWKQGWDISNIDYDSILVVYYPNLLAYLGYMIWMSVFVIILSKVLIKKNER